MPSSYSPNLKIELIAVGEQTDAWGGTTNDNFENVFEEAITGMATAIFPADADYDWAAGFTNSVGSQAQRNLVIEVQGTLSTTRNLIVPTIEKQYLVHNATIGGQAIVVKTLAGTGITVPNGQRAHLYVNGTDVIAVVNYFPALRAGAATFDTALPVASGGTGSTSLATITVGTATNIAGGAANRIPYNTGAGVTSFIAAPTAAGTYLEWNGTGYVWTVVTSGVTTFSAGTTGLTPATATSGAVTLGGTLNIANGGSGQTTAQAAMNVFAGAVTSGSYLRGNGTNVVMSAIQAADVPTLNQNTTGHAAGITGGASNRIIFNTAPNTTSFIIAPTIASTYLQWDGANFAWATVAPGGVTTFSGGTTGLTPAVATSGAITLGGVLNAANGGTGVTTTSGSGSNVLSNNATLLGVTLNDGYTEEVYAIPSNTTPALTPNNGSIQTWTLSGNSTPSSGTWSSGQSIVLMVNNAAANSITWSTLGVTWFTNGGTAPPLSPSMYTTIVLWKVGTIIYGARVGDNL